MDALHRDFGRNDLLDDPQGSVYARHKTLGGATAQTHRAQRPTPTWERVSPFDAYPAPQSRSPQQGDFIERVRFRRELHDLKGVPGYQDDQIDRALRDYYNGHLEGWLWTEAERQRLEQETLYMWLSPPGIIDALNYWGSVPGWKLMSWGVAEDLEETRGTRSTCCCAPLHVLTRGWTDPLSMRPYFKACYDRIPGSFWGHGIPDLAAHRSRCATPFACARANNMSMASGLWSGCTPTAWRMASRPWKSSRGSCGNSRAIPTRGREPASASSSRTTTRTT